MLGSFRLLLALMVVLCHLVGTEYVSHFGFYAVRAFFVISGYCMTAGLNDVYKFDAQSFWRNRLLRLLPAYYFVCLLTILVLAFAPEGASQFIPQWRSDLLWHDAITDVLIVPLHHLEPHVRLIPAYWSVAVEIEMYLLLFFFIARSERCAFATLAYGAIYHAVCIAFDTDFAARYTFPPSATLSFALGALIYFRNKRGGFKVTPQTAGAAFILWIVNTVAAGSILSMSYVYGFGYYVSTGLGAIVVAGLVQNKVSHGMKAVDRYLGELAYPVFLCHWLAGLIIAVIVLPGFSRGWWFTLAALPLIAIIAVGIAWLNQQIIEPFRRGPPPNHVCFAERPLTFQYSP
jgi:peptidoglycan/LPS O-acetylase OafA/YrhL